MTHSNKLKLTPEFKSFSFEAIGTHWTVELAFNANLDSIKAEIFERIKLFDSQYSRFRDDSLVTTIAQQADTYTLPDDALDLLTLYKKLYDITGGLMTPLIGNTMEQAGYDKHYSLKADTLQTPFEWEDALDYLHPTLRVKKPVLLDFGAAGKGYLVDIIAAILDKHRIESYVINAGGDILHTGSAAVEIGLENPDNPEQAIGIMSLKNQALCGSAGNRRAWKDYNHIINPQTLVSPQHIKAVWVSAKNCLIADALSTALFFVSPEMLQAHFEFEYAIIHTDNSLSYSTKFKAEFF